jgi:hypothetical protein
VKQFVENPLLTQQQEEVSGQLDRTETEAAKFTKVIRINGLMRQCFHFFLCALSAFVGNNYPTKPQSSQRLFGLKV